MIATLKVSRRAQWIVSTIVVGACLTGQAMAAEVFEGTAKFRNAENKSTSVKVTITVNGATSDADRQAVVAKLKANPESAKSVLAALPQLGFIEAEGKRVPIRYAYVSTLVEGKNLTVLSDEPLGYIGGTKKDAASKEGFDLTYAMISTKPTGAISGELGPATKLKIMESGAPAPERYDNKIAWLDDVKKTTKP